MATKQRRIIVVLLDGLGDLPMEELGGKTPLEAAVTPTFDALAKGGFNGLMDPVEPGLACGSDTAHLSIFGYDPRKYYRGRGAFETIGAGLPMVAGDIAFKCNFATLDPANGIVVSRRADRRFEEEGPVLSDYLNDMPLPEFPEYSVAVKYATEHRCGVRLRGPKLSDNITGTDPLKDNLPLVNCTATDDTSEAKMTADLTNYLSSEIHKRLMVHPINRERIEQGKAPANCVLLRGCGALIDVPQFQNLHGMRGFMIAPTAIIAGLGASVGVDIVKVPEGTGDYRTNLDAKARMTAEKIKDYDFGFMHVKAVDDAGHDKDVKRKIEFIEKADRAVGLMVDLLSNLSEEKFIIVVTGDHTTPIVRGDHSCEPVPLLLSPVPAFASSAAPAPDRVAEFGERAATLDGGLGRFCGIELMKLMQAYAGVW